MISFAPPWGDRHTEDPNGRLHYFLHNLWKSESRTNAREAVWKADFSRGFLPRARTLSKMPPQSPAFLCRVADSMYRLQSSDFLVHNGNMYMLGGPTIIFCKWQFVKYFLLKKIFKSEKLWLFRRSVLTIKKIIIPYKSRPRGNKCDISINVNGIFMF